MEKIEIKLTRTTSGTLGTLGEITFDSLSHTFATIERPWLDNKRMVSCIPEGRYEVIITHSGHFNKDLPHVLNVPDREGVLIHNGNTMLDSEGCIIIGDSHQTFQTSEGELPGVNSSKVALGAFLEIIKDKEVWLTIRSGN